MPVLGRALQFIYTKLRYLKSPIIRRISELMNLKYICVILLFLSIRSLACNPVLPAMIPPVERGGEFTYVYPPSFEETMLEQIEKSNDIALIKANLVWAAKENSREYSEIEVLYGWGKHKGRFIKLHRENYFCGDFTLLKEGVRYVATMENGMPQALIEYSKVAESLKARGEPEYVYTAIGVLW